MNSLSFPINMAEGSEPKVVNQNQDDPYINSTRSAVKDSNDTREETFADHMQKEPENDAPNNNNTSNNTGNRDQNEDSAQKNTVDTDIKIAPNFIEAKLANVTDKGLVPTIIGYGEAVFAAPVEVAQAETPTVAPAEGKSPIQAVVNTRLIEAARPGLSQLEKTLPTYETITGQVVTGDDGMEFKPKVQNTTPILVNAAAIKAPETAVTEVITSEFALTAKSETAQSLSPVVAGAVAIKASETAVAGAIGIDLPLEAQPETRSVDLKSGEFEVLEKPELSVNKTIKPVVGQAASIAPSTYMLTEGELEIDLKAMPSVQEAAATPRSALSASVMGTNVASASQTANAAAAGAAAQVIAAIKADKNSSNIEVRLDPPELGRVRISFTMESADAVKAVLSVERAETLDHLRRNVGQFMEDLKMAGFGSVDIEFSEHGSSEFAQDMEFEGFDSDPSLMTAQSDANDIVYLSLRDDAQLNVLV